MSDILHTMILNKEPMLQVGDIVAFKSHPYFNDGSPNTVYISGDPEGISPLMIVIETLNEGKDFFDENTGMQTSDKQNSQCHCLWFSHKNHEFQKHWISSKLLKLIKAKTDREYSSIKFGEMVCLSTASIEIEKKKISLKGSSSSFGNKSVSGLLSFVCPVLHVIGNSKNEAKEPLYNSKNGSKKRELSSLLIKCKYYNSTSNKMSEVLLPLEALEIVTSIDENRIDYIEKCIRSKDLLIVRSDSDKLVLISPELILNIGGQFYLEGSNLFTNEKEKLNLNNLSDDLSRAHQIENVLPKFEEIGNKLIVRRIDEASLRTLIKTTTDTKFLRIRYKDSYDNTTWRIISDADIFRIDEERRDTESEFYLKAYCHFQQAVRYFRMDRIQQVQIVDVTPIIESLETIIISEEQKN